MTHHTDVISKTQQLDWFLNLDTKKIQPFLFLKEKEVVGYGLINYKDQYPWITGGLLPEYRGQGMGKLLFITLITLCRELKEKVVMLDVLNTNTAALALYNKLGFNAVETNDTTTTMRLVLD
jgi:ribosomal protein S18 acetylase RimI-like enzyme